MMSDYKHSHRKTLRKFYAAEAGDSSVGAEAILRT